MVSENMDGLLLDDCLSFSSASFLFSFQSLIIGGELAASVCSLHSSGLVSLASKIYSLLFSYLSLNDSRSTNIATTTTQAP